MGRGNRQHASKPVDANLPDPSNESAETPPGPAVLPPPADTTSSLRARFTGWLKKLPFVSRAGPQPSPAPKVRRGAQPSTLASTDPAYQPAQRTKHADVERDPHGPFCQASVSTAPTPSVPSAPVGTPLSTTTSSAGAFSQGSCTDTTPNASRGAQPSVVASTDQVYPSDPRAKVTTSKLVVTELAIATRVGLRTFIHDPHQLVTPICDTNSILFDDSDDSSDSSDSSTPCAGGGRQGLRYRCISQDVWMVLDRLCERGFRERQPSNPRSALAQPRDLGNEVQTYLSRPPNAASQIRILILSGHNAEAGLTINEGVELAWGRLRRALQNAPPGIVTVVILACCRAGEVLQYLVDIPNTVLIAACANEVAVADNYAGDYFLDTLLEVLDIEGGFDQWKDFEGLLSKKLKKHTKTQSLRLMTDIKQEPSDIFRALMKPSYTPTRGRTSAVAGVQS